MALLSLPVAETGLEPIAEVLADLAAARDRELHADPDRGPLPGDPRRLAHLVHLPARSARHAELRRPLPPEVSAAVPQPLWSHQAEALDLIRSGRSAVLATGTASGKSRCYQLALAEAVATPVRTGTGLVVFPTKALARDQLRALTALGLPKVVAGAYDGDASPEERTWIRKQANVVFTNPEMLHAGLLPHHERWSTFLGRLQYVVLDELHTYRGTFGGHVAQLVRRLRRLAHHHGADPTFLCCSATVGEPQRLASAVTGVDVVPVLEDGSPTRRARSRCGSRRCSIAPPARARRPTVRRPRSSPAWSTPVTPHSGSPAADAPWRRWRPTCAGACPGRSPVGSGPTAPGTSRRNAARSRTCCSPVRSRASSPRRRSSSASTSGAWTPWCSTASPARSRRSGSRWAGPGAARTAGRRPRCSSPVTTSSTSGSWPIPRSCSVGRPSLRS